MVSHEHRCRRNSARNADFTAPKTPSSPQRLVPVWRVESGLPRWSTGVTASWLHHKSREETGVGPAGLTPLCLDGNLGARTKRPAR
jgi:hypothetical protein